MGRVKSFLRTSWGWFHEQDMWAGPSQETPTCLAHQRMSSEPLRDQA